MTVSIALFNRNAPIVNQVLLCMGGILLLVCLGWLQEELDLRQDRIVVQIEGLAQLPQGEYLKPALLGYHHLGADILWLRLLQVIGKKRNSEDEYEWIYHALDVVTTLDPQYAYAYYAGGVILGDLANRPDLSNRLLERGVKANPDEWNIPFLLGYNHYFLLGDPAKGAQYIMQAASLPGGPSYLPGLATRMAAEAGSPETALAFLEVRLRETQDPEMREFLANRMKEVIYRTGSPHSGECCGSLSDATSGSSCNTRGSRGGRNPSYSSSGTVRGRLSVELQDGSGLQFNASRTAAHVFQTTTAYLQLSEGTT